MSDAGTVVAFALVAAAAGLVRFTAARALNGGWLPWGTLSVNVAGSALLGALSSVGEPNSTLVGVAGLGTLTTFSAFALEVHKLLVEHERARAAVYVAATVIATVGAAWAGLAVAA